MDTLKGIEKIIRESAFDKKKKKLGLKFNPRLAVTGIRTTGPWIPEPRAGGDSAYETGGDARRLA